MLTYKKENDSMKRFIHTSVVVHRPTKVDIDSKPCNDVARHWPMPNDAGMNARTLKGVNFLNFAYITSSNLGINC